MKDKYMAGLLCSAAIAGSVACYFINSENGGNFVCSWISLAFAIGLGIQFYYLRRFEQNAPDWYRKLMDSYRWNYEFEYNACNQRVESHIQLSRDVIPKFEMVASDGRRCELLAVKLDAEYLGNGHYGGPKSLNVLKLDSLQVDSAFQEYVDSLMNHLCKRISVPRY